MHLLIATDGEPHSDVAVQAGAVLAQVEPCVLTVLTVVRHEAERKEAAHILRRAASLMGTAVSTRHVKTRVGHPAEEIAAEAAAGQYDLILLGQRPEHGLLARLLGPVTQQVMEQISLPLLIAKHPVGNLHRLLLCDSGAQPEPLLDRFTAQLPQLLTHANEVTVLHVMSQIGAMPGIDGQHLRATAAELIADNSPEGNLLERDVETLVELDVCPQPLIRHGLVVDEILNEAAQGVYDLVVIGAHCQEAWPRFLLDDLAAQIVRQIDRTVLVIR